MTSAEIIPIRPGMEPPSVEALDEMYACARGLRSYQVWTPHYRRKFINWLADGATCAAEVERLTEFLRAESRSQAEMMGEILRKERHD